jgi:hypothetical protein
VFRRLTRRFDVAAYATTKVEPAGRPLEIVQEGVSA